VFAPTDAAFAKLPAGIVASLLKPENKARLAVILKTDVESSNAVVHVVDSVLLPPAGN